MMDLLKNVKAKVAQNNAAMGTSSSDSLNNGFSQRIDHVADNVNKSASIFTSVYGDAKASAEAEVKEINNRLKKQQRTQAIIGALTTAASLAPQAMSLLASIKACKSASTDTKTTPQQKQSQIQEFTQKIADAEKQVETYTSEIATLNSDIENANNTITEQTEVSKTKQKEIDDAKDAVDALTKSKDDETDETLVSLNNDIKRQNTNKADGENDLAKANAMPDTIQQKKVVNGQVQYVTVKNTNKAKAKEAAEKKIKAAEEEIKKLEKQKTERKAELDKQIAAKEEERKAAVNAKREADEAVANAQAEVESKKDSVDEKTKAKDRLEKTEIPQLKSALEDLKKAAGATTSTTQTQTTQVRQQTQQTQQVAQEDPTKKKQS